MRRTARRPRDDAPAAIARLTSTRKARVATNIVRLERASERVLLENGHWSGPCEPAFMAPRLSASRSHRPCLSHAALLDRIVAGGLPDRDIAERALKATLSVLGQRLTDDEALALSAVLEDDLARTVEQSECDDPDFGAGELYERVSRQEDSSRGRAREHVDIVVRALGEAIDDDLRTRLARALPERVGRSLFPPEALAPPALDSLDADENE